jgi:hypothetical protein
MQSKKVRLELLDIRNSWALKMEAPQSFQLVTMELFSRLISLIRKRQDNGNGKNIRANTERRAVRFAPK